MSPPAAPVTPAARRALAGAPAGLTSAAAAERLRVDGPNLLPQAKRRRPWHLAWNVVREPMVLLLLGATAIYLVLGDPGEAALLGLSVLLVIGLTVYQERKSERALQALRDLSSPRARVLRDGQVCTIAGRDVVVGDVILVAEGDRVPADARVLEETDLHADESMLTGESVAVRRTADAGHAAAPALDGSSRDGVAAADATTEQHAGKREDATSTHATADGGLLHASTLVVRGRGSAQVVATGPRTAVGRIGESLRTIRTEATPMQRDMRRVVGLFATVALASCVAMTALYGAMRGDWLAALLAGITLAMANIPEEFPVVLTVFLALGAWRMARHQALVRRAPAIEALGAITVLCTDKTGTLTENRMAVAGLVAGQLRGTPAELAAGGPPALRSLLEIAAAASLEQSFDPMDRALRDAVAALDSGLLPDPAGHLREYPLSPACPAVAHAWRASPQQVWIACKGAPETVAGLCRLADAQRADLLAQVDAMARDGLRVLGVASARMPAIQSGADALPPDIAGLSLQWCGLVAFADPLRPGVADAVAEARGAGIRVVMLTGDHAGTARAIAQQAGVATATDVVLGAELDALDTAALRQRLAAAQVFARVRPEHKLRLVDALKADGGVVAMTGDGVNDAPALMAAHVGIAMGRRGTDVAREAAAIVLLDDNFVTVVEAIRMGRTIYDNIRRAVRYILAVHVPITGLALLPMFTGGPLVLLPLHVVFLELIIDPACSIVFERETAAGGIMRRPPRPPDERLLGLRPMLGSLALGLAMFATVVAAYAAGAARGLPSPQVGALAFTAVVAGNLGLIVLFRSGDSLRDTLRRPNAAFWIVVAAALGVLVTVTRWSWPAGWFGFSPPPMDAWLLALALPLVLAGVLKAGWWRAGRRGVTRGR